MSEIAKGNVVGAPGAPFAGWALAFLSGLLFAAGLVLSGMTQPSRVLGFLDFTAMAQGPFPGGWDPTLAFVMGGAVAVTLLAFWLTPRWMAQPWAAPQFALPTRRDIDAPLLCGAAVFGAGWGLAGYCPGPALASIVTGGADALWFTAAMLVGMALARWWLARPAPRTVRP